MAAELHDHTPHPKPLHITALRPLQKDEQSSLNAGASYSFCVNLYGDPYLPTVAEAFRRAIGTEFPLGTAQVRIEAVKERWPGGLPWERLVPAEPVQLISMRFVRPTSFRRQGKQVTLPDPGLVFRSLLQRWSAWSPLQFPEPWVPYLDEILVPRFRLETAAVRFARHLIVGAVGTMDFRIPGRVPAPVTQMIAGLARFAAVAGVGYGTARTLGEVRVTLNPGEQRRSHRASAPEAAPPPPRKSLSRRGDPMSTLQDELLPGLTRMALERGWHNKMGKWGRSGEQTLFAHAVDVFGVAAVLLQSWEAQGREVTPTQHRAILAAAFTHDWGKEVPSFRAVTRRLATGYPAPGGAPPKTPIPGTNPAPGGTANNDEDDEAYHHAVIPDLEEYRQALQRAGLTPEEADLAAAVAQRSAALEGAAHKLAMVETRAAASWMAQLVWAADRLVSLKGVPPMRPVGRRLVEVLASSFGLQVEWHAVGMVRGMVTQMLHRAAELAFADQNWRPVLRSATGTLYLGPLGAAVPERVEIQNALQKVLVEFHQQETVAPQLGPQAFGSLTATVIPAPELLFLSPDTVQAFWQSIAGKGFFARSQPKPEEVTLARQLNPALDDVTATAFAAEAVAGIWALYVLKSVVVQVPGGAEVLDQLAAQQLGLEGGWNSIASLAHTSTKEARFAVWRHWYPALKAAARKPGVGGPISPLLAELLRFGEEVTLELQPAGAQAHPLARQMEAVAAQLLSDLSRPGRPDLEQMRTVYAAYTRPKARGSNLCPLCGAEATLEDRYLDGAESFSNFLAAGAPLGSGNKRRICPVCRTEAKLRDLMLDGAEEAIYIIPQVTLSPQAAAQWAAALSDLLAGIEVSGLPGLNHFSEMAAQALKGLTTWNRRALAQLAAGSEKQQQRQVQNYLKQEFPSLDECREALNAEVKDWAQAARLVAAEPERLGSRRARRLRTFLRRRAGLAITPEPARMQGAEGWGSNFLLVQLRQSLRAGDESESAAQLRQLFVGLYLARLLSATVIFPDHLLTPVSGRAQGAVMLRTRPAVRRILERQYARLGTTADKAGEDLRRGIVSHQLVEPLLQRLAALVRANNLLELQRAGYGRAGLLKLALVPAGEALQRYLLAARFPNLEFVQMLDIWEGVMPDAAHATARAQTPAARDGDD